MVNWEVYNTHHAHPYRWTYTGDNPWCVPHRLVARVVNNVMVGQRLRATAQTI